MKCEEFEDRLNQVLDERQRPEWDLDLRAHGEHCAECREMAASYCILLDGFYALTTPPAPANLSVRVLDELHARPSTARRNALVAAALATAAVVALAVWPVLRSTSNQANSPVSSKSGTTRLAAQTDERRGPNWEEIDARFTSLPVVGPMLVSMRDTDESTDPYETLAKSTGQGLANVVLYMPRFGGSPGVINVAPAAAGSPGWPSGVSDGFKPVSESVSETLDLLLHALPMGSANRS